MRLGGYAQAADGQAKRLAGCSAAGRWSCFSRLRTGVE